MLIMMKFLDLLFEIFCNYYDFCNVVMCCMEIVKFNNGIIEVFFNFDECVNFFILIIERIL